MSNYLCVCSTVGGVKSYQDGFQYDFVLRIFDLYTTDHPFCVFEGGRHVPNICPALQILHKPLVSI